MSPWTPLLAMADALGRCRYVELACFRSLGGRALLASDATAGTLLAAAARAHAWRAVQLEELLPVSVGLPGVETATRSPGEELDRAIGSLGVADADADVLDALGAVLYPALLAAYRERAAATHPAADRPVLRTLRRVSGDLEVVLAQLHEVRPEPTGSSPLTDALAAAFVSTEPFAAAGA